MCSKVCIPELIRLCVRNPQDQGRKCMLIATPTLFFITGDLWGDRKYFDGRESLLGWLLSEVQNQYQYILLDCPPSLGLLTLNALTAADAVYIPLQAQYLAMQGLAKLQQVIGMVGQQLNKRLQIGGVFITQYDSRKVLHRNVKELAEQTLGATVCKTTIRDNIALAEAPTAGQTIYQYAPKSKGAADYMELAKEIHKRSSKI